MAKTEEITYEVLVLINNRWDTQAVYSAREQARAMADARSLEKVSTIQCVKVLKEVYNEQGQPTRSVTVFQSKPKGPKEPAKKPPPLQTPPRPKKQAAKPKKKGKGKGAGKGKAPTGGGSPSDSMAGAPQPLAEGQKRPSLVGALLQFVLSVVVAVVAAIVVTQLASVALRDTRSIGFLNRDDFLIVVFILVFAVTALALITRILSKLKNLGPNLPSFGQSAAQQPSSAQLAAQQRHALAEAARAAEADARKQAMEEAQAAEEEAARKQALEELERKKQEEDDLLSEIVIMNGFTADALDVVKGDPENRDPHTVFGLVLFLVGGIQTLRHQKQFSDDTFKKVVDRTLGSLGLSQERAQRFIEQTDEYLISNARYSQMFQAGRTAMAAYLDSEVGPRTALAEVLGEWEKPKAKAESAQPVTVLFTDIAGSTAMTQELGDAGAQEVVRVHNTIVRGAIQAFGGKEIKHTGDGIMASFPSAAAGVEAAVDMQSQTRKHNAEHPDRLLGLKVGLNAGEPISEDDDLFGTTVQLAARIVDKAAAGQILVSGSVYGLSQGKNLKFEKFGDLEMKGFDEPVTVYTAVWGPTAKPVSVPPRPVPAPAPQAEQAAKPQPEAPQEEAETEKAETEEAKAEEAETEEAKTEGTETEGAKADEVGAQEEAQTPPEEKEPEGAEGEATAQGQSPSVPPAPGKPVPVKPAPAAADGKDAGPAKAD